MCERERESLRAGRENLHFFNACVRVCNEIVSMCLGVHVCVYVHVTCDMCSSGSEEEEKEGRKSIPFSDEQPEARKQR